MQCKLWFFVKVTYKTNNGDKVIPDHDTFTPDETKSEPHVKYVKAQNSKHYTIGNFFMHHSQMHFGVSLALVNPRTNKILWFVSDIKGKSGSSYSKQRFINYLGSLSVGDALCRIWPEERNDQAIISRKRSSSIHWPIPLRTNRF